MPYNPDHDLFGPNFQQDLAYGEEGEQIVQGFLTSLSDGSFEVKRDRYRNGRMVVETEQSPQNRGWQPSGLKTTKATWWVYLFSNDGFVIVSTDRLKKFIKHNFTLEDKRLFAVDSDNPAKGYLLMEHHVKDLLTNPEYD
jgi:hypothetical protein